MTGTWRGEMSIETEHDIIRARQRLRQEASAMGFGLTDATRIVTAVSELARNIYLYAGNGTVRWRTLNSDGRDCLEIQFEDHGPGIADVAQALEPGYSSGRGLGMGLPGTRRLMDEMEISSEAGSGTSIIIRKWRRR